MSNKGRNFHSLGVPGGAFVLEGRNPLFPDGRPAYFNLEIYRAAVYDDEKRIAPPIYLDLHHDQVTALLGFLLEHMEVKDAD